MAAPLPVSVSDFSTPMEPYKTKYFNRFVSTISRPYNMRPREHEFQLPDKQNSINERNFLIRIFYLA